MSKSLAIVKVSVKRRRSACHTNADLAREIEAVTDMTKSRPTGFHEDQPTLRWFLDLFAQLRQKRIIPA